MTLRKSLVMAICLVLGALAVWKAEQNTPPPVQSASTVAILPGVKAEEIKKIASVGAPGSYSIQRRTDGSWELRKPEGALADQTKSAQIAKTISSLTSKSVIEKIEVEEDLTAYGLIPPELVVTIDTQAGRRGLFLGKKTAVSGRRYLQIEGESRLFLIDENVFSVLNVGLDDVRDRLPIKFDRTAVKEMAVSAEDGRTVRFVNGATWTVETADGKYPADKQFIEKKLDDLLKLKVKNFVDEAGGALAIYGLNVPKAVIRIRTSADEGDSSSDVVIQAGEGVGVTGDMSPGSPDFRAVKSYYIKISGQPFVYEVSRPFYTEFLQRPEYYRPRDPLMFLRGKPIGRIEGEISGESPFALIPHEGAWRVEIEGVPPVEASGERVKDWLEAAVQLRVISYPGAEQDGSGESGLQKPAAQFKIFVKDRPAPVTIALGLPVASTRQDEGGADIPCWAAASHEDGALLPAIIGADACESLKRDGMFFRKEP